MQSFYEMAFDWSFTDYGPEYRAFTDGKMNGGFYHSALHSSTKNGAALIVLYSEDLESLRDKVASSGGLIIRDIFEFPGGRRLHYTDPNGNELAVWSDSQL